MTVARRKVATSTGLYSRLNSVGDNRWHWRMFLRVPIRWIERLVDLLPACIFSVLPGICFCTILSAGFGLGVGGYAQSRSSASAALAKLAQEKQPKAKVCAWLPRNILNF